MAVCRPSWQSKRVAADDKGLRSEFDGPIGEVDAVSIREPPIGDHQRVGLRIEALPRLGGGGRDIDPVAFVD